MWAALRVLAWLCCFASAAVAQVTVPSSTPGQSQSTPAYVAPVGGLLPTNGVQTCGPATGTLNAAGQSVTLPFSQCPGVANYLIVLTTPNGQTPLIGTLSSTDTTTGGSRRLLKTGVGALETSTEVLNGGQGASGFLEYRTVGGGYGQSITLTGYTSGQATVTILGLYNPTSVFINGSVDDREDVAARQGRLYTATTGVQNVTAGSYLSMTLAIPSSANFRAFIVSRVLDCNVTGTTVVEYAGVSNPTANPTTTASTVTNRGNTGGPTSSATLTYGIATTHPDQNPAVANPPGGFIEPGPATVLGKEYARTVSPGQSFSNWIGGSGGGLTTAARCFITYLWYEENVN